MIPRYIARIFQPRLSPIVHPPLSILIPDVDPPRRIGDRGDDRRLNECRGFLSAPAVPVIGPRAPDDRTAPDSLVVSIGDAIGVDARYRPDGSPRTTGREVWTGERCRQVFLLSKHGTADRTIDEARNLAMDLRARSLNERWTNTAQ